MEKEIYSYNELKEKKEYLLEALKKKIDIVNECYEKILEESQNEKEFDEIKEEFEKYKEKWFNEYPDAAKQLNELKRIREEKENLQEELDLFLEKKEWNFSQIEEIDVITKTKQSIRLKKQIETLENNDDVRFLESIEQGLKSLFDKNVYVRRMKNKFLEDVAEEVNTRLKDSEIIKIKPQDVIEKEEGSFYIILKIKQNKHRRHKAFFIEKSPFIVIEDLGEGFFDLTKVHEKQHCFLEGFLPESRPSSEILENSLKTLNWIRHLELVFKDNKDIMGRLEEVEQRMKKEFLSSIFLQQLVDGLHKEIVPETETVSSYLFDPMYREYDFRHSYTLTSDYDIKKIKQRLRNAMQDEKDEELKKRFSVLGKLTEKRSRIIKQDVLKFIFISDRLQEKDVMNLIRLLSPNKFLHIETYIRHFYGDDVYEGLAALYEVRIKKSASKENIKKIAAVKDRAGIFLNEGDKAIIDNLLTNFPGERARLK